MRRKLEETIGLVSAFIVILAVFIDFKILALIFASVLVVLFLFRLSWGKEQIHYHRGKNHK